MTNNMFLKTSKGIINRNLIVYVGFYNGSKHIEVSLIGGFSFRFQGDEALMIMQALTPCFSAGHSSNYEQFIHQACSDAEQANELKAMLLEN
jgi:hypothetical protein